MGVDRAVHHRTLTASVVSGDRVVAVVPVFVLNLTVCGVVSPAVAMERSISERE